MKNRYPGIIYLCGFSGAGKTVCGEIFANLIGYSFCDSDCSIESKTGKTIAEIFADEGEESFRQIEADVIQTISQISNRVISLGGGAILNSQNLRVVKEFGILVYLQATLETIESRLEDSHLRPLLISNLDTNCENSPITRIETLFKQREKQYLLADIIIATDRKSPDEVADEIKDELIGYV